MIRGSIARRTSSGTTAEAAYELIAAATGKGFYLREMQVILAAATASTYGLGRPAAIGVAPTSPVAVLAEAGSIDMATLTAVAWTTTKPTIPAQFFRRVGFPATITSFITWTFNGAGLLVQPGQSLVLWNLAANGVVDVNVTIDECTT